MSGVPSTRYARALNEVCRMLHEVECGILHNAVAYLLVWRIPNSELLNTSSLYAHMSIHICWSAEIRGQDKSILYFLHITLPTYRAGAY